MVEFRNQLEIVSDNFSSEGIQYEDVNEALGIVNGNICRYVSVFLWEIVASASCAAV